MVKKTVYFMLSLSLLFLFFGKTVIAETTSETTPKEIDIETNPEKILFNVKNFKPGDWSVQKIEIKNNGLYDFQYFISSMKKAGSTKLYNALDLTIKGETEILFHGKMSEFEKLEKRDLKSGESEIMELTVRFPMELGNEYQGLSTVVEFQFYAEGEPSGGVLPIEGPNPGKNGSLLPSTATEYYQLLLYGGLFLIGGLALNYFSKKFSQKNR